MKHPSPAARNRLGSAAIVAGYLAGSMWAIPDPERRAGLHAGVIVTLGYGHLLGAALRTGTGPARRTGDAHAAVARRWARTVLGGGGLLAGFVLFTGWGAGQLPLVLGLLAISTWHTAENDLALEDTYAAGCRPAPPRWTLDDQLAAIAVTTVLLAAATATLATATPAGARDTSDVFGSGQTTFALRGLAIVAGSTLLLRERSPRLETIGLATIGAGVLLPDAVPPGAGPVFADVFAAATGYHLASWLWLAAGRARRSGAAGLHRVLLASHAPPALLAAACLLSDGPGQRALREAFFAPAPYLFWSVVHVVHTLVLRSRRRDPHAAVPDHEAGSGSRSTGTSGSID